MSVIHVVGDVHGERDKLRHVLLESRLIDTGDRWTGADSTVWFMGDLVDHGPDGLGVVDLVMRLQAEAKISGGRVESLIGNHDILLLAAFHFGDQCLPDGERTFREEWRESGGVPADFDGLTTRHVAWLSKLPTMAREDDRLLIHGDTLFYLSYGRTTAEVNSAIATLLGERDADAWARLLDEFSEHRVFAHGQRGPANAAAFLDVFGGRQIIHGHTPICKLTGQPPEAVREPLVYAQELCVDVDSGMYLGGPGFDYLLVP